MTNLTKFNFPYPYLCKLLTKYKYIFENANCNSMAKLFLRAQAKTVHSILVRVDTHFKLSVVESFLNYPSVCLFIVWQRHRVGMTTKTACAGLVMQTLKLTPCLPIRVRNLIKGLLLAMS